MKKLLLSLVTLLCMITTATAGDVLYKTLTFPGEGAPKISAYDQTWTAKNGGITWTISNFNNNNNGWTYIKCGGKKGAFVGSIRVGALPVKVSKIDVNVTGFTENYVNKTYLEVASDSDFTKDVQKVEVAIAKGVLSYVVPSKVTNAYYRVSYDCKQHASTNGLVVINKVEIYQFDDSRPSNPSITPGSCNIYEATDVTITCPDAGTEIYYSTDSVNFTKYTAPINITATTNLFAYAEKAGAKSDVVKATYTMAKTYANLDALLTETPTAAGWPVIVPIQDETINSFYLAQSKYKNGVYLERQAGGKNFELYASDVPEHWAVGDKLSGTAKGIYQQYNGQWEISLINWDDISNGKAVVKAPTISFDADTKTVTITPASEEYNTFYTTDGTTPTDASTVYEGPFTISKTTTVKAISTDENDQPSSVASLTCTIAELINTVAALNAACTATEKASAPTVTFTMNNVLVTGANGSYVFVRDATGSTCFFGNGYKCKKGDILSGTVTGLLYAYNNMPELCVNDKYASMTIASSSNPVTPETIAVTDITKADASKFIRFENLTYVSQETSSSKVNYTFTDGTNEIILRDNFTVLGDKVWSTSCKYNINVYVIPFKTEIQYYACSSDDVEVISTKKTASITVTSPTDGEAITYADDKTVNCQYTKDTDATLTFASSDEEVATFESGIIYLQGLGVTTLTIEAPETEQYMGAKASFKIRVVSGNEGNLIEKPYEVGDALAYYVAGDTLRNKWVHGYICGYIVGSSLSEKTAYFAIGDTVVNTNILIAASSEETSIARVLAVSLPSGKVRTALNLKDNQTNLYKEVWLLGNIMKYMGAPGMKDVKRYSFDGTDAIEDIKVVEQKNNRIYNLAGQQVQDMRKGNIYIIDGKKVMR